MKQLFAKPQADDGVLDLFLVVLRMAKPNPGRGNVSERAAHAERELKALFNRHAPVNRHLYPGGVGGRVGRDVCQFHGGLIDGTRQAFKYVTGEVDPMLWARKLPK